MNNVIELLDATVDRYPDKVAVICEGEELTYDALDGLVRRLSGNMPAEWGIGPGGRVARLRTQAHDARVFLGWRSIGTGGYSDVEVPGDTFTMLRPPHASVLGKRLSEILNASQ